MLKKLPVSLLFIILFLIFTLDSQAKVNRTPEELNRVIKFNGYTITRGKLDEMERLVKEKYTKIGMPIQKGQNIVKLFQKKSITPNFYIISLIAQNKKLDQVIALMNENERLRQENKNLLNRIEQLEQRNSQIIPNKATIKDLIIIGILGLVAGSILTVLLMSILERKSLKDNKNNPVVYKEPQQMPKMGAIKAYQTFQQDDMVVEEIKGEPQETPPEVKLPEPDVSNPESVSNGVLELTKKFFNIPEVESSTEESTIPDTQKGSDEIPKEESPAGESSNVRKKSTKGLATKKSRGKSKCKETSVEETPDSQTGDTAKDPDATTLLTFL